MAAGRAQIGRLRRLCRPAARTRARPFGLQPSCGRGSRRWQSQQVQQQQQRPPPQPSGKRKSPLASSSGILWLPGLCAAVTLDSSRLARSIISALLVPPAPPPPLSCLAQLVPGQPAREPTAGFPAASSQLKITAGAAAPAFRSGATNPAETEATAGFVAARPATGCLWPAFGQPASQPAS